MTHIRTVRDLIAELQAHSLDLEVGIPLSPTITHRILGVLEKNGVVYLDYSTEDGDKLAGFGEVVADG